MMLFKDIAIGSYFTMKFGLLWRKISETEAADVWSGHIVAVDLNTDCHIQK